jgi:ABC-type dipeptide/oligopeptide/nickel transport system permease subunit
MRRLNIGKALMVFIITTLLIFFPWHLWFEDTVNLRSANLPISLAHLLGTDALGRDHFIRLTTAMYQTIPLLWLSIAIATVSGLFFGIFRIMVGVTSKSQFLKNLLFFFDSLLVIATSIPITVISFLVIVYFEADGLGTLLFLLWLFVNIRTYLWVRQSYLISHELGYWQANDAIGGNLLRRIIEYGLKRDWFSSLAEMLAFHLKAAIIIEVSLSYLGFGVQEPNPSIGNMLSLQMERFMAGDMILLFACLIAIWVACSFPKATIDLVVYFSRKFKEWTSLSFTSFKLFEQR